jgi:hypothetical protein
MWYRKCSKNNCNLLLTGWIETADRKGEKMKCCHVCGKLIFENEKSISVFQFNLDPDDKYNNLIFDGVFTNHKNERVSLCKVCTVKTFAIFAQTLGVEKEEEIPYLH